MADVVLSGAGRNSPLDDATAFITASSLKSPLSNLKRLLESVGSAVLTLEAADKSIAAITDVVESAVATVQQALRFTSTAPNNERAMLETRFNDLRTQIDQLASDAGFNGVNLLQGDNLSVNFNEATSSSLTISGVNFDASGLSITAAASGSFQHDDKINNTLAELDKAINTLRSQAAIFGSNLSVVETQKNFTENLIYVLETSAAGLTLADTSEEGANLLALQTRQQLSSVAVSLASQSNQNVLRHL